MDKGEWYYPEQLARTMKEDETAVMKRLQRMAENGEVMREAGKYKVP